MTADSETQLLLAAAPKNAERVQHDQLTPELIALTAGRSTETFGRSFAAFEESDFAPHTGEKFRDTVLAQGGSKEAMDLFVEFRGRKPSIEPLLRQSGLLEATV